MAMAVLDLVLVLVWIGLVSIMRGAIQYRRTGTSPLRFRDRPGSPQWWSRLLSAIGVLLAIAAPLAELAGLPPFAPLDEPAVRFGGVVLVVLGIAVTIGSQLAMGASWRGDVDPDIRTPLVTSGPFRLVRNPIFSGAALTAAGLALVMPNVLSLPRCSCCSWPASRSRSASSRSRTSSVSTATPIVATRSAPGNSCRASVGSAARWRGPPT